MKRSFYAFFLIFLIASCSGGNAPAPSVHHGQGSGYGSAGAHTVSAGDTLYRISNRYKLPMRDIAVVNRLAPPFKLTVGQRLRLPPPRDYRVRYGDTLYGVSRLFGVNSTEMVRLNNLKSPYILQAGQTLRLPSVIKKPKPAIKTSKATRAPIESVERAKLSAPQKKTLPPTQKTAISKPSIVSKDGVPIPQNKPVYEKQKAIKVSKVRAKTPKRASTKFLRPVRGKTISGYGAKKSGLHNDGVNISAARGTKVQAAENGVVVYSGNALKGSGNLILIRHADQWMTAYAHLEKTAVKEGQTIKRGQVIGAVGSTGSVSTPQLHFEIRRGTSAKNPVKYME